MQLPPTVIELRSSSHDPDFAVLAKPIEDDPGGRWRRRRRITDGDRPRWDLESQEAQPATAEPPFDAIATPLASVPRPPE